jgi:hypothetical protein
MGTELMINDDNNTVPRCFQRWLFHGTANSVPLRRAAGCGIRQVTSNGIAPHSNDRFSEIVSEHWIEAPRYRNKVLIPYCELLRYRH